MWVEVRNGQGVRKELLFKYDPERNLLEIKLRDAAHPIIIDLTKCQPAESKGGSIVYA